MHDRLNAKFVNLYLTCIFYNRHLDASIFMVRASPIPLHVPRVNNSFCNCQQTDN